MSGPGSELARRASGLSTARARTALELAEDVGDVKRVRDQAEAIRAYAKNAGLGLDMQNEAARVKLDAERKAGAILTRTVRDAAAGRPQKASHDVTLSDLGVTRKQWVRTPGYVQRADYANEFTIRARRDSGAKTELAKVLEGWGDYLFYGHGDGAAGFTAWMLGDLRVFRLWFNRRVVLMPAGDMPGKPFQNGDGTHFRSFKIDELPEGFVIARMAWDRAPA